MSQGVYLITEMFEKELAKYTGAKYAIAVDNCSNALFLALTYDGIKGKTITIPARTYPSVPCEILHSGGIVEFAPVEGTTLKGAYALVGSRVIDSALRFTCNMYVPGYFVCLSFTGTYKHLNLGKGGAILTNDYNAYSWFKRARFSGRRECSYHDDDLNFLGWNFTIMPEIATRGLQLMQAFYDLDGNPKENEDKELPYPDLSKFPIYTRK